ncbi:IS110 family RNA-guided transposase [Litoribacter populi]|uniref:IS110 family transposase n=1 Tax=Litoribacter populi TaxID=2598460 RepID=UPI00117D7A43|nr:IS110 family transposase [Litoribacter populi]
MPKPIHVFIGVDISKDNFDFYFKPTDGKALKGKVVNNAEGFLEFFLKLPENSWVVMEASGPYYYQLASFLYDKGVKLSVINPLVIKRFTQMQLKRTKTDSADAHSIATYGGLMDIKPWEPLKECYMEIKQWYVYRKQLLKHQHAILMKLEAFIATGSVNKLIRKSMEEELLRVEENIKDADKQMNMLIEKENGALKKQLESVPGIGPKTSLLLIVALRGFDSFETYKQVISYLGLSPRIYESGTSVKGKAKICKMGMAEVRKCLYMAARAAKIHNNTCKDLYLRLRAKGKAHRVAMIAVVNKLIKQAFAIAKSGIAYDKSYSNFNAVAK